MIVSKFPGRKNIIDDLHLCHQGIEKMKSLTQQAVWWPDLLEQYWISTHSEAWIPWSHFFKPFNGCKHIIVVLSYRRIILLLCWIPTPYFYESWCWLYSSHGAICILKMLKCMHICLKVNWINWINRSAKPGQILGRSKIVNHFTLERSPKPWWKK